MKYSDNVLYVDNHLLVAHKPAGISTQPYFEEEMKEWVRRQFKKEGAVFLHPIHRLDRPVSGLVLFARTSKALSRLNEQMRKGSIQRTYCAEVEGALEESEQTLEHYLVHGEHRALLSTEKDPKAKRARLHFRVIAQKEKRTKVLVTLETGRYHQIRAQFGAYGHPIIGDTLYGASEAGPIHLHCKSLSFLHPTKQEQVTLDFANS